MPIFNAAVNVSFLVEHSDADAVEELVGDMIVDMGEHPAMLADVDPMIRVSRVG